MTLTLVFLTSIVIFLVHTLRGNEFTITQFIFLLDLRFQVFLICHGATFLINFLDCFFFFSVEHCSSKSFTERNTILDGP